MKGKLLVKAVVAAVAVLGSLAAGASTASATAASSTAGARHIEWDKSINLAALRTAAGTQRISPLAAVTCYGDTAHPVVYGNTDTWADFTLKNSGLAVKVQYWFCQRYSGDPVGINFAYGWVEAYQGNWTIQFGQNWSYQWDGASIHHNGCVGCKSAPDYFGDGIGPSPLTVTVNSSQWVSDRSTAGPGNYQWSAQFWVRATNQATGVTTTLAAVSPTF